MKWFVKQFLGYPDRWPEIRCDGKWYKLAIYRSDTTMGSTVVLETTDTDSRVKTCMSLDRKSAIQLGMLIIGMATGIKSHEEQKLKLV